MPAQKSKRPYSVPKNMQETFESLVGLTDACCKEYLNDEYAELCRQLAAALCRKRPSPVLQGKLNTWAAAVVHAIGSVNFLFDPTQDPHLTAEEVAKGFGVGKSTMSSKSTQIRKMMRMQQLDPAWCLPSKLDDNPLAWMIQVDGFIIDARSASPELQEEAYRMGLIPYIPGEARSE